MADIELEAQVNLQPTGCKFGIQAYSEIIGESVVVDLVTHMRPSAETNRFIITGTTQFLEYINVANEAEERRAALTLAILKCSGCSGNFRTANGVQANCAPQQVLEAYSSPKDGATEIDDTQPRFMQVIEKSRLFFEEAGTEVSHLTQLEAVETLEPMLYVNSRLAQAAQGFDFVIGQKIGTDDVVAKNYAKSLAVLIYAPDLHERLYAIYAQAYEKELSKVLGAEVITELNAKREGKE